MAAPGQTLPFLSLVLLTAPLTDGHALKRVVNAWLSANFSDNRMQNLLFSELSDILVGAPSDLKFRVISLWLEKIGTMMVRVNN